MNKIEQLIGYFLFALVVLVFMLFTMVLTAKADVTNANITFSWDAVTTNTNGTPCTDLAGYAVYRSREPDNWGALTGADAAFLITQPDVTNLLVIAPRNAPGVWFWAIRAFDLAGNFSDHSNVVETDIDVNLPAGVENFKRAGVFIFGTQ